MHQIVLNDNWIDHFVKSIVGSLQGKLNQIAQLSEKYITKIRSALKFLFSTVAKLKKES